MARKTVTRRQFVAGTAAGSVTLLAGCVGGASGGDSTLSVGGSSTVYPITSDGASVWNSNPPASDAEYWGPGQYGIATDQPMADYWAGLYGFEGGDGGGPPFRVTVGLSHSGTGLENLEAGQLDIGDSSAPVGAEFPDRSESALSEFVDHVVGVDGQPIVVSRAIYEAGVTKLTGDQIAAIYRGELTHWSQVEGYSGPEREIQAVGRVEGSGTDTSFRANLLGGPDAPMPGVDVRKGQNQQVQTLVRNSDNAIAYLALAFVDADGAVPPVAVEINGTTYRYGENLGARGYPLSRDLHCYTYGGTSEREAAFLNMLLSEYGQQSFVAANNYFTLPDDRLQEERTKLPPRE
ncbi:MAG: PstS family phosphate ABC transporter substrate-binding protein [Halorientalis sp.]